MKEIWKRKKADEADLAFISPKDEELLICMDLLRQMNHTITIAPMVRFFSAYRVAADGERDLAIQNFSAAVKAITAFSILWRSSRKGTEAIDSIYRELMSSGCDEVKMKPLSRSPDSELDVDKLKKSLVFFLEKKGKISSKNDWVNLVSKMPAYSNHKDSTRFILLAAAHDSAEDRDYPGLNVKGKKGLLDLFTLSNWKGDTSQTIEHIAPQNPKRAEPGWLEYSDPETLTNKLGNLTLLPTSENSSVGNGSWARKRLVYKILSAETQDHLDVLMNKAKDENIDFSMSTTELLNNARYLPMVRAISKVNGDWSERLIEDRTRRIAELAWLKISPWLDLE